MEQRPSWEANSKAVKEFPTFYGTRRFITVFTRTRHWSLYWARWIQFTFSRPVSLRSTLTLTSHPCLDLLGGLFPSAFPTKIFYAFLISPWFDHSNVWWSVQVTKLLITRSSPVSQNFLPLRSKYSPQHLFSNTLNLCSFLNMRNQVSYPYKIYSIYSCILIFKFLDKRREDKTFWIQR
jgi:hypothetical protein